MRRPHKPVRVRRQAGKGTEKGFPHQLIHRHDAPPVQRNNGEQQACGKIVRRAATRQGKQHQMCREDYGGDPDRQPDTKQNGSGQD